MTDSERLDWLERAIATAADRGQRGVIVMGAWWSGPEAPDGYSVEVGDLIVNPDEYPTLRDAIDAAIESQRAAFR